jgi:hypothetical protein
MAALPMSTTLPLILMPVAALMVPALLMPPAALVVPKLVTLRARP